jgi:hypothetical protein
MKAIRYLLYLAAAVGAVVASTQAGAAVRALLGSGRGLDRVVILAQEPGQVAREYRSMLGFASVIAGGSAGEGAGYALPFADGTSLVIAGLGEARDEKGPDVAERREGAAWAALDVAPLDRAAEFLQSRGFTPREVTAGASAATGGALGAGTRALFLSGSGVIERSLSFVARERRAADEGAANAPRYANTARRLAAVWIAVKDAEKAAATCEAMELSAARRVRSPQLGARGREIKAGQGTILLLEPEDPEGSLATFLNERGEGVIGLSLQVARITSAHRLLVSTTRLELPTYTGLYGRSFVVPPDVTHGVWMEFFQ